MDLFALLSRHAGCFTRFGGHRLAAGAALSPERFADMKADLNADLLIRFPDGLPEEPLYYEDELPLTVLTPTFAKELTALSPFGEGNREPLFLLSGMLSGVRLLGRDGMHLGATLSDKGTSVRLVAFGAGECYADWSMLKATELLVKVSPNRYHGKEEISIRIEALRAANRAEIRAAIQRCIEAITAGRPLPDGSVLRTLPKVSEEEIRSIYRMLKPRLDSGICMDCLYETECTALLPLLELGVVRYENGTFFTKTVQEKKQIQNALLYRVLCLE